MTSPSPWITITISVLQSLGFVFLYLIIGFGPGFIFGLLLANWLFGRGLPTHKQTHFDSINKASKHNAQWDPKNERWQ